jgi:hypothetical protein
MHCKEEVIEDIFHKKVKHHVVNLMHPILTTIPKNLDFVRVHKHMKTF